MKTSEAQNLVVVIRIRKILARNWPIAICLHCVRTLLWFVLTMSTLLLISCNIEIRDPLHPKIFRRLLWMAPCTFSEALILIQLTQNMTAEYNSWVLVLYIHTCYWEQTLFKKQGSNSRHGRSKLFCPLSFHLVST